MFIFLRECVTITQKFRFGALQMLCVTLKPSSRTWTRSIFEYRLLPGPDVRSAPPSGPVLLARAARLTRFAAIPAIGASHMVSMPSDAVTGCHSGTRAWEAAPESSPLQHGGPCGCQVRTTSTSRAEPTKLVPRGCSPCRKTESCRLEVGGATLALLHTYDAACDLSKKPDRLSTRPSAHQR